MKNKALLSLLIGLLSISLAFAGGNQEEEQGDSGIAESPTVINFWNGLTGPDGEVMYQLVEEFNELHPDIQVEQQQIMWNTYWDRLLSSLVAGNAPEVFVVHTNEVPVFSSRNVLEPLDKFVGELPNSDRIADVWEPIFRDGHMWGIPLDFHPLATYYNKDLLRESGMEEPTLVGLERNELLNHLRELSIVADDGTATQFGFAFPAENPWFKRDVVSFAAQYGDAILDDEGMSGINSSGFVEALTFMKQTLDEKIGPSFGDQGWDLFRAGRVAMFTNGPWMMLSLDDVDFEWGIAPYPQIGPERAQWISSHTLHMPKGLSEEKQQAAWTFMKFLSEKGVEWAAAGQIPARHSQLESDEFAALDAQYVFSEQVPYGVYEPINKDALEIENIYVPLFQSALIGEISIEEALEKAENEINRLVR